MEYVDKCPECGSRRIGVGELSGYAAMAAKEKMFASSAIIADVCSDCGLIIRMRVKKPEKFAPKEW